MRIRLIAARTLLVLALAGCATPGQPPVESTADGDGATAEADRLHAWLTGAFESKPSGVRRGEASRLMLGIPILGDDPGRWIYVVQWKAGSEVPDRQFVYHLHRRSDRDLALDIYSLLQPVENPTSPSPESLESIRQSCLERRKGCRVLLSQDGLSFVGGTRGRDCPTEYRNAQRLRIELVVREDEVREWLQGYDAEGNRLWSAGEGGRVFHRVDGD